MIAVEVAFWLCTGLIAYTHLGYPLVLWALTRGREDPSGNERGPAGAEEMVEFMAKAAGNPAVPPRVSLIVAA